MQESNFTDTLAKAPRLRTVRVFLRLNYQVIRHDDTNCGYWSPAPFKQTVVEMPLVSPADKLWSVALRIRYYR